MSNHRSIIIIIIFFFLTSFSAIECKVYKCTFSSSKLSITNNNILVWSGLRPLQWAIERYKIVSSHSFWLLKHSGFWLRKLLLFIMFIYYLALLLYIIFSRRCCRSYEQNDVFDTFCWFTQTFWQNVLDNITTLDYYQRYNSNLPLNMDGKMKIWNSKQCRFAWLSHEYDWMMITNKHEYQQVANGIRKFHTQHRDNSFQLPTNSALQFNGLFNINKLHEWFNISM